MRDPGEIAYDSYCESRDWKSVSNQPLPTFEQQSDDLKRAWRIAAAAVINEAERDDRANALLALCIGLVSGAAVMAVIAAFAIFCMLH